MTETLPHFSEKSIKPVWDHLRSIGLLQPVLPQRKHRGSHRLASAFPDLWEHVWSVNLLVQLPEVLTSSYCLQNVTEIKPRLYSYPCFRMDEFKLSNCAQLNLRWECCTCSISTPYSKPLLLQNAPSSTFEGSQPSPYSPLKPVLFRLVCGWRI